MFIRHFIVCCCSLLVLSACVPRAHTLQNQGFSLPTDPALLEDTLANGLSYSIRSHDKPEGTVEFHLLVHVGSLMEQEGERGLAHFLEHLAFDGGRHFSREQLREFLDQQGLQIGRGINASTGMMWTQFRFRLRNPDDADLQQAMHLLEDWIHGLSFPTKEIRKEQAIVLEEKRQNLGLGIRIQRELQPFLWGEAYAHPPIGEESDILAFNQERVSTFYRRWYRPELMQLVVVGDVNQKKMQSLINKSLGKIQASSGPAPILPMARKDDVLQKKLLHDIEVNSGHIVWQQRLPAQGVRTKAETRVSIQQGLYFGMLNSRLQNIPPHLRNYRSAYGGVADSYDGYRLLRLSIGVKGERYHQALQQVTRELARIHYFGFTISELEREKSRMLISLRDRTIKAADNMSATYAGSDVWVAKRKSLYTNTSLAFDEKIAKSLLPRIRLHDVNHAIQPFADEVNQHLYWVVPEQHAKNIHIDDEGLQAQQTLRKKHGLKPYDDGGKVRSPVMQTVLIPGKIDHENHYPETGITEMQLSNGARVLIKPSSFKKEEVLFRAVSPGGLSVAGASFRAASSMLSSSILQSNLGGLKRAELNKYLADKRLNLGFGVSRYSEGIHGATAPQNIGDLLQLVSLLFQEGNIDDHVFAEIKQERIQRQQVYEQSPGWRKQQKVYASTRPHNDYTRPLKWQDLEHVQASDLKGLFKQRFGNAADFTFYFVGDVSVKKLRPWIRRYLASLPAQKGGHEQRNSLPVDPLAGRIFKEIQENIEPKSSMRFHYHQATPFSMEARQDLHLLAAALQKLIFSHLREKEKLIYSGGASSSMRGPDLTPLASLNIGFSCKPEQVTMVRQRWEQLLRQLKNPASDREQLFTQLELDGLKKSIDSSRKRNMKKNGFWLSQMTQAVRQGLSLDQLPITRVSEIKLDYTKLSELARTYLHEDSVTIITYQPK